MNRTFRLTSLFFRRLDDLGLAVPVLCHRAGIPADLLAQDDRVPVTTEQLFALWQAIADVSGNPAIGLELGTEPRIERYDPIAMAGLYARSFGDALARLARYKQLTCPEMVVVSREGADCALQFDWPLAQGHEPPVLIDACFAWVMTIARRGTGTTLTPRRVEFRREFGREVGRDHGRDHVPHLASSPATGRREMYETHFRCPVHGGAARNAMVFEATDLDRPFVTHNPELLRMLTPQLDAELRHYVEARTTSDQVKGVLKQLLAGRRPAMRDVARELGLSPRTLQRRLGDDGVSFQQLLVDARRELARHYLLQPSLELNETAYLLGYGDPNSFFRAFHHWEGTSPGQWRALHMARVDAHLEEAGRSL